MTFTTQPARALGRRAVSLPRNCCPFSDQSPESLRKEMALRHQTLAWRGFTIAQVLRPAPSLAPCVLMEDAGARAGLGVVSGG